MAQEKYTFPQDHGTDAYPEQEGDPNDAANFGSLIGATQNVSVIVRGLGFLNVDYTNLTFDVKAGKAYLVGDGITAATSGESRDEVGMVNGINSRTGLALTDNAVNHVYATTDPNTNNSPSIEINTTETPPTTPSVKIGEIDTSNNTTSEQWNLITQSGQLSFPDEAAALTAETNLSEGTQIYERTDNTYYKVTQ